MITLNNLLLDVNRKINL